MDKSLMTNRIDGDSVSFFSNDLSLFTVLYNIDPHLQITEANVLNTDTMYFKKTPKYKFRTYFRGRKMPITFPDSVTSFIDTYKSVKVCSGLERFVKSRTNWNQYIYMHNSYYVDYNDESMITILHMLFGNMVGKTYSLDKEP